MATGFNTRMKPSEANRLTINGLNMCQTAFNGLEWKTLKVTSEIHSKVQHTKILNLNHENIKLK